MLDEDEEFNASSFTKSEKQRKVLEQEKKLALADPEYRAILERTSRAQQDTVDSSDNAVRTLRETRKVSESTKTELVKQGEQIEDIKASAKRADQNVDEAYDNTRKIDKYSRFIPWKSSNSKKKKEDRELEKQQKVIDKDVAKQNKQALHADGEASQPPNMAAAEPRRQFDDPNEQRIDDNLNEMSSTLKDLRQDAQFMQGSIQKQDNDLKEIQVITGHTQNVMDISDKKLQKHL